MCYFSVFASGYCRKHWSEAYTINKRGSFGTICLKKIRHSGILIFLLSSHWDNLRMQHFDFCPRKMLLEFRH